MTTERPLAEALVRILGELDKPTSRSSLPPAVPLAWKLAAGDYLGDHSRPRSLENGTLVVAADSTALKRELGRLSPVLVDRLRSRLDCRIDRLEIVVARRRPGFEDRSRACRGAARTATVGRVSRDLGAERAALPEDGVVADGIESVPEELRPVIGRLLEKHAARKHAREGGGATPASRRLPAEDDTCR